MPQPRKPEAPTFVRHLICPKCLMPMRIRTVEATAGHDKIQFTCEHCGSESMQDNRRVLPLRPHLLHSTRSTSKLAFDVAEDEICPVAACLFDHLVGAGEQRWRHLNAECLGGLQVNNEFVLGRRLHW